MADAISIQELIDARTDAKTLEEAVNGDAVTTVLSRLGESYPTLANALSQIDGKLDSADAQIKQAITDLFQNGGLPATPFATKALMTASALVDGDYAMVTDDSVAENNGLYVKTAGAWVKSAYDPLTQAKTDATTKADAAKSEAIADSKTYTDDRYDRTRKLIDRSNDTPLLQAADSNNQVYLEIDADAGLHLSGLKSTVQDSINNAPAKPSGGNDIVQFLDANNDVSMRQSVRGDLFVSGLSGSVQAALGGSKVAGYRSKNLRDRVSDIAKPFILDLVANQEDYVPPPMCLIPNKYNIPNSFVNAFTVTVPSYTSLDSVYGDNDYNVHSHLIEFPRPFRGYRYFMANTPYSSTAHENPLVYGSNDLITFDLLDGMPQPLDQPRTGDIYNFRADVGFTYDPIEGDLICTWISVAQGTNPEWEGFWYSRTKDGYTWTEPRQIKLSEGGTPALLYNMETNLWHIWHLEGVGQVRHSTAPTIEGPWTDVSFGVIRPTPESSMWHLEVKFMGNKPVMVANTAKPEENLYLGVSDDWDTWQWGKALIAPKQDGVYKGGFLPEFDGDKLTLLMVWNTNITNDPENTKRLFINRTNTINLSELI